MIIQLVPGRTTLAQLRRILFENVHFELVEEAFSAVEQSATRLAERIASHDTISGVNTGFGKLASVKIADDDLIKLQQNLVRSHCAGVGSPLKVNIVRLIMALKCISLGRGASGVRPVVIKQMQDMVKLDIIPVIPEKGSVGASGDLAPLAHMAAALIGEGEVFYQGTKMPASQALEHAGLTVIELQAKEGLALLNGTQVSTALALAGLFDAWELGTKSLATAALSIRANSKCSQNARAVIRFGNTRKSFARR